MLYFGVQLLFLSISLTLVSGKSGKATFFTPGLGACGKTNTEADFIVAAASGLFLTFPGATDNPNDNPICNQKLTIHYKGKTASAEVTDECPTCPGKFDLDLSPAVFNIFADPSVGVLHNITWEFDDCSAGGCGKQRRRDILPRNDPSPLDPELTHKRRMVRRRRYEMD